MSDSDELISRADALLGRLKSGPGAAQPPPDYPILTDVVESIGSVPSTTFPGVPAGAPALGDQAGIEHGIPSLGPGGREVAGSASTSVTGNLTASDHAPLAQAPLGSRSATSADSLVVGDANSMEDRLRIHLTQAIESRIAAYLDVPLRVFLDETVRRLAAEIAAEMRKDILAIVREAALSMGKKETATHSGERSETEH